jgi:UDP-glucuronate decarboxylase
MTKFLLTGATGFVGARTLAALAARDAEVVAVTRGAPGKALPGVTWLHGDLTNADERTRLVREAGATHLLHLGWRAVHGDVANSPENIDWLGHSLALTRAFIESGGQRVIGCGTCFEYDWRQGVCVEELTPIAPSTLYGAAKHAFHVAVEGFAEHAKFSHAWARPFFIYGEDEHPTRLVASVAHALLEGRPAETSHGRQIRDYLHIDDVAEGLAALALSDAEGAYNIASGQALTLKDIIFELADQAGRPDLVRLGARQAQPYEPPIIIGDSKKAQDAFGWRARIDLKTGVAMTLDGMRARKKAS